VSGAGYMVARMLGAAPVLADAVIEQLCAASDAASDADRPLGAETEEQAQALSAAVWHSIWPVERCERPAPLQDTATPIVAHPWADQHAALGAVSTVPRTGLPVYEQGVDYPQSTPLKASQIAATLLRIYFNALGFQGWLPCRAACPSLSGGQGK
jgi:hypothetical protein